MPFTPRPLPVPDYWKRLMRATLTPRLDGTIPYQNILLSLVKKCMASGERIWLADGRFVPVEELIGHQKVWSFDGDGFVVRDAEVSDNGEDEIFAIRLRTGRVIRRTPEHPLLTWSGWRAVQDLRVGDSIALPARVPSPKNTVRLPDGLPAFIGYMIGDGGLTGASTPKFSQNDGSLLEEMRQLCARFGGELRKNGKNPNTVDYVATGLAPLCREYGLLGKNSYQHSIPDAIFRAPNDQILECLSALIATDGWVSVERARGGTSGSQIGFCTVSARLAEDVCALWARLGHYPLLRERPMPNGRLADVCYNVLFGTAREIRSLRHLHLPGKQEVLEQSVVRAEARTMDRYRYVDLLPREAWGDLFAAKERSGKSWNALGLRATPVPATWAPVRWKIAEWARACGDGALADKAEFSPIAWDRIESIDHEGRGQTYAVSVPGTENYLAHEISHNSSKSAMAAGIGVWWGVFIAPDAKSIVCVANKREMAQGLAFRNIRLAFQAHPMLTDMCEFIGEREIRTKRGVRFYSVSSDGAMEAGVEASLIIVDELWGQVEEKSEQLWTELTPVPTLHGRSARLITSYAGWKDRSKILWRVHEQWKAGEPVAGFEDLVNEQNEPIMRYNRRAGLIGVWDDQRRMPWQIGEAADQYYEQEAAMKSRAEFDRVHRNQWSESQEGIEMEDFDACVDEEYRVPTPSKGVYLALGVDASYAHDMTAVVSVYVRSVDDGKGGRTLVYHLGPWKVWQPEKGVDFNISKTAGEYIRALADGYSVRDILYDPYQFHDLGLALKEEGLRAEPYKQTIPNVTLMGNLLCEGLRNRQFRFTANKLIREQMSQVSIQKTPNGEVLKKDKQRKHIDWVIALAMARVAASTLPESGDASSWSVPEVLG